MRIRAVGPRANAGGFASGDCLERAFCAGDGPRQIGSCGKCRDRSRPHVRINLTDGTIQFTQPVNGVVFGAVFHGKGRLQAEPPNPQEAQQLRLFTRQDKLNVEFTEATFSFTDGLLDEVAKQVKWQAAGPSRR